MSNVEEGRRAGKKMKSRLKKSGCVRHSGLLSLVILTAMLAGLILSAGCTGSAQEDAKTESVSGISVTDSQGNTIQLSGPATRIVCLNSDATEMFIDLGAGDTIVGVTETTLKNSQLVPLIPNAVSVGTWSAPSLERILELNPDAIISYSEYRLKNADQFERENIPVIYVDCNRLSTIKDDARIVGVLTGHEEDADRYISFVDKWEDYVTDKVSSEALTKVYVEGYSEYMAQGSGSSIDDMVSMAGGSNLAAGLGSNYVKVTPEWIIKENPPVIIKIAPDPLPEGETLDSYRQKIMDRSALVEVQAVVDGNVYALSGKLAVGPRAPAGLPIVAAILHPEVFEGTDPYEALNEYSGIFLPGANTTQAVSPSL